MNALTHISDAFCVVIGLFGTVAGISSAQIVRSIRILRIVRIFKRFKTLQQIVIAISKCVAKILHTFLITAIIIFIYSVVTTQSFGWLDPRQFGSFSLSVMTMVQVMTGDGWMTDIVRPLIDIGENHDPPPVAGFGAFVMLVFFSFILIVFVVMLNVTVSVLLEGFLTAMSAIDAEEEAKVEYSTSMRCLLFPHSELKHLTFDY
jgi:voltage-gated sodium channel